MTGHDCRLAFDQACSDCVRHDETCGVRCDSCDERMCEWFGPVPQTGCRLTCTDCDPCNCTNCTDIRWDAEIDAQDQAARDERIEL